MWRLTICPSYCLNYQHPDRHAHCLTPHPEINPESSRCLFWAYFLGWLRRGSNDASTNSATAAHYTRPPMHLDFLKILWVCSRSFWKRCAPARQFVPTAFFINGRRWSRRARRIAGPWPHLGPVPAIFAAINSSRFEMCPEHPFINFLMK